MSAVFAMLDRSIVAGRRIGRYFGPAFSAPVLACQLGAAR